VGDQAPPLCGTTLDGGTLTGTSLEGKPVLVNFWASWCVPCRDEFPLFKAALVAHPDLVILGVVYQDPAANARTFAASFGATWSSLIDPDGSMAQAYKIVAPPQSYFIDRGGLIRSRQIGALTGPDLERQLAAIER
jgi:cytochrome c biogenesis protein CcmG, thiol:disulfide interchange protein DsbE